jgi:hypothetical protein
LHCAPLPLHAAWPERELARGEKQAEAMMHIARTCDDRVDELKVQHAAALRGKDDAVAALKAELEAVNALRGVSIGKLESWACCRRKRRRN